MGVFDQHAGKLWTFYAATLTFRDKVMAGTPNDPEIIEGWIRTKAGLTDEEELRQAMVRTLGELGADVRPDMSYEELTAASKAIEDKAHTNSFKRDATGIYLESRTMKAMLKEVTNILFAGDRWGKTSKGPRSFLAERVFVNPDRIHLCKDGQPLTVASGTQLFIGHTSGPRGPQSNLTKYEYAEQVTAEVEVMVLQDCIKEDHWPQIWLLGQESGWGSLRSQGFGRFDIERWEVLPFSLERLAKARRAQKAYETVIPDDDRAVALLEQALPVREGVPA